MNLFNRPVCLKGLEPFPEFRYYCCCCSAAKLCPTLCDPMDCSPPGSSVHGVLQARILEWVAISSSRGSYWSRDQICVSCICRRILYHWAHGKHTGYYCLPLNEGRYRRDHIRRDQVTWSRLNSCEPAGFTDSWR